MTIKQHMYKYLILNIPIFVVELINIYNSDRSYCFVIGQIFDDMLNS